MGPLELFKIESEIIPIVLPPPAVIEIKVHYLQMSPSAKIKQMKMNKKKPKRCPLLGF